MTYEYNTRGTCSSRISFDLEGNVVHNVRFTGGCNGNLKGISSLVEGMTVEEIEKRCAGICCGAKNTSCPDQLVQALRKATAK